MSTRIYRSLLFFIVASLTTCGDGNADESSKIELQRMRYNNPGLVVDLGVGLWGWPLPLDYDQDGDLDLVVSCSDVPYNGTYFFENPGGDAKMPVFKPAVKIAAGVKNIAFSLVDGKPRVLVPGSELTKVFEGDFDAKEKLYPQTKLVDDSGRIRANQWGVVDFDGDGSLDLFAGHGLWGDYGWDNAFNEQGEWTRGPLHGHVYLIRNRGTTEHPEYEEPKKLDAGGEPVDVFGMPSPCFADFDGDGDLDLMCGDFLDGFTYFQNTGSRKQPEYAAGRELQRDGELLNMHLCMIVVTSIDWDRDGDVDLVVGQEDGRVALVEHTGRIDDGMPVFAEPVFFKQEASEVKFGALVTPVSFDWDGDGDEDLVCGNTAGEIGFIENLDDANPPKWAAPVLLEIAGEPIRIMAGDNGSIQGPAETKWGYTTIDVVDWDHDGLPDILANSIWGKVVWYRNVGSPAAPKLSAAAPITVQWSGAAPYPAWNWWKPSSGELATQWRTTPTAVDWNRDGLNDLVMLDHEGYLAFYERQRRDGELILTPGKRIFQGGVFDNKQNAVKGERSALRLNNGEAGKSGRRKLCIVDWDGDGLRDILVNSVNVNLLRQQPAKGTSVVFTDEGPLSDRKLAGHTTSPTTVDWDGDGKRELLVGAEDGFLYHAPVSAPVKNNTSAKPRKNVLFIAVDDLRVELGCYGSPVVKSPNIDRLASAGLLFERAYCQQALCNPSRASLLTGLRPDTLGITDLPTHFRDRHAELVTLPQLFKANGYHAQGIGKLFHNWRQDDWKGDAKSWSVAEELHYATHGSDKAEVDGEIPSDEANMPRVERRNVPDEAYFDGRIAAKAIAALRHLKGKQFFLGVGFWKPHLPFNAPKKYWDVYDPDEIALPVNPRPPVGVPPIALHDSRELMRDFKSGLSPQQVRVLRHGYYAATSFVDTQIGKVIDELDRLGMRENTIIVFWSDHGFHLGEHDLWCKTSNFELDAHVPLIISVPGQKTSGQRTRSLVELLDLYPTLADLCELEPPDNLEGTSLVPILDDAEASVKDVALTQHPRPAYTASGQAPDVMGYSIRSDRFRYTQWRRVDSDEIVAEELYDHATDPGETENLANSSDATTAVADHAMMLAGIVDNGTDKAGETSRRQPIGRHKN